MGFRFMNDGHGYDTYASFFDSFEVVTQTILPAVSLGDLLPRIKDGYDQGVLVQQRLL